MCFLYHGSGRKAKAQVKERRGNINKRDKDQVDILQYQIPLASKVKEAVKFYPQTAHSPSDGT
jgi:hypothetical protein